MLAAYHLNGGAPNMKKLKIGASIANAGIVLINGAAGAIPCTTTDFADSPGMSVDTGTYSTTQGDAEGLVTCSVRSDLVLKARMCGGATEGTVLVTLSNTAASAAGTTVSDTDITEDFTGGVIWCTKGANVGQSRIATTFNDNTSLVTTVPFLYDIAVGDEFLACPYTQHTTGAGQGNVQATTVFTEANATIAAGTGGVANVVDLELRGASDSYVLFKIGDHIYDINTL